MDSTRQNPFKAGDGAGELLKPGETWSFKTDPFDYSLTPKLEEMNSFP
jgi:hypothetical protein